MTENVDIRSVDQTDIPMLDACSRLLQDLSSFHARNEPQLHGREGEGLRPLRRFQQALQIPQRAVIFVAIIADPAALKVIGVTIVHLEFGEISPVQNTVAVLTDLIVSAEHQRRGTGRRLFEAAHQWAIEKGANQLAINVRERNVEGLRFYEAVGCQAVSRWMTLAVMERV